MPLLQGANGTIKGLTRMFGGGGRGKKPGRGDVYVHDMIMPMGVCH